MDFYTNGVYRFYNNVFWGCANLSQVTLPQDTPGCFIIPAGTFGYCSNLRSIELPENTGIIEQMAFYRSGLESFNFTTTKEECEPLYLSGYYTFAACENLTTITVTGKVKFNGLYTFQDCTALETATFTGEDDDYTVMNPDIFKRCSNLESVDFYHLKGNGQDNDMDSVFTDCKKLVRVTSTLPPEISKIGYSCFDGCESLTTLSLPEQAFAINETAFRNCKSLTSLELADLTSIGTKAFAGCSALTSIKFTNNPPTETIEDAFDEWHFNNTLIDVLDEKYSVFVADAVWQKFLKLKHPAMFAYTPVEGGYSITKGQFALADDFAGMFEVPAEYESGKVVAIADEAFKGLTGITGVTLHKDLTAVGANAFAGCTGITNVISERTEPLTADACPESAFAEQIYTNATLTVPFGSLEAYSNCAPWSAFSKIEQGLGERTLAKPTASPESCDFKESFDLTLTNPNESGIIYYYVIPEGDTSTGVRSVAAYEGPITVPATNYTVVAYITDGTVCSEPITLEFTFLSCRIDNTTSVPEGSQVVGFTTDPEQSLDNVVIDNIYYSINDEASGMDSTNGLVLNATSSIEVVHQFNSDVENGLAPATYFNGLAVKVQGVGSITFTDYENKGNARLTLVLGDGSPVYVDELEGGKYTFSLPVAKYLYIFASQTAPSAAPQLKAPSPGENSVTLTSMTLEVSDLYISTVEGLDKILAANAGESYRLSYSLNGHYFDGTYLYASTIGGTGSSKNTYNLGKVGNAGSDDYFHAYQDDWVAISGLTEENAEDYLGEIYTVDFVVEVVSNDKFPVISLQTLPTFVDPNSFEHHSFRVENFNYKADNLAVSNIWLIAPQPAEYCTLRGFVRIENIHTKDGYLELMSEEYTKFAADDTPIPPLSVKVYYSNAAVSDALDITAWYDFTGIVSREGEDLVFTALTAEYKLPSAIENVEAAGSARISAGHGTIHVACDTPTTIAVYTMTGQLVATVEAATATIAVAPGLYLVKAGPQATKLSVR
ncbi:MAG: leucine-rich repeat domain-containing protein [Muribaculaceae bacterium]